MGSINFRELNKAAYVAPVLTLNAVDVDVHGLGALRAFTAIARMEMDATCWSNASNEAKVGQLHADQSLPFRRLRSAT